MGVVYRAYDLKLDRDVAVKFWNSSGSGQSESLQREATALAAVKHPNVVPVYDFDVLDDGRAYFVMELIDGSTLEEWLAQNTNSKTRLGAFIQAGAGLQAAHERDVVHRDFKPTNCMVETSGRVRVVDFGLARTNWVRQAETSQNGEHVHSENDVPQGQAGTSSQITPSGTALYLAPEQWSGQAASPLSDQFSFCVALFEALYGTHPFVDTEHVTELGQVEASVRMGDIRWAPLTSRRHSEFASVLERGLERAPEDRWPSMRILLTELQRTRRKRHVRRAGVLAAFAAVVALTAAAVPGYRKQQAYALCEEEGRRIFSRWNEATRGSILEQFESAEAVGAARSAASAIVVLEERASEWSMAAESACRGRHEEQTLAADTQEAISWCLAEQHLEFDDLVGRLLNADSQSVYSAVDLAGQLRPAEVCVSPAIVERLGPSPPAADQPRLRLARGNLQNARLALTVGRYEQALETVISARESAESVGWTPAIVDAQMTEATVLASTGHPREAVEIAKEAHRRAARSGAWREAASVATLLTKLLGQQLARSEEGLAWSQFAEVAIAQCGDPLGLLEAKRLAAEGQLNATRGRFELAAQQFDSVLEARTDALGDEHPSTIDAVRLLADTKLALLRYEEAEGDFERVLARTKAIVGDEHPRFANALASSAGLFLRRGEYGEAITRYRRAIEVQERTLGPTHPDLGRTQRSLSVALERTGALAEALSVSEGALAMAAERLGDGHPDVASSLSRIGAVHYARDDYEQAGTYFENALKTWSRAWYTDAHPDVAMALHNLGLVAFRTENLDVARELQERALAGGIAVYGAEHPRVARYHYALLEIALAQDRSQEAISHGERALEIRLATQVPEKEIATVEFGLGATLWETPGDEGGDRERGRTLMLQALSRFRELGMRAESEALQTWIRNYGIPVPP